VKNIFISSKDMLRLSAFAAAITISTLPTISEGSSNSHSLVDAAAGGEYAKVYNLLSNGASPNSTYQGTPALLWGSEKGHLNVVELLINKGADVNKKDASTNMTALMVAASEGHEKIVNLLVGSGADIHMKDRNHHATALMSASEYGYTKIAKLLLNKGASVNAKNNVGYTPLSLAISNGHFNTTKLLVSSGANVNVPDDKYGLTPTMVASLKGSIEIVQYLLDHNAKVGKDVKANNGMTTIDLAKAKGHHKIAELIRKHLDTK